VWFATLTFKREVSSGKAFLLAHGWVCRLMQAFTYKTGQRFRWVQAMALQRRGVIHFHLLICGKHLDVFSRMRWEHRWRAMDRNTGYCRVYQADMKNCSAYLVRELSKEGELTCGGDWRGLNTPGAVSRCCDGHKAQPTGSAESLVR